MVVVLFILLIRVGASYFC
ncbi:YjcZ family sporulation protein [Bacillus wiedmannii]